MKTLCLTILWLCSIGAGFCQQSEQLRKVDSLFQKVQFNHPGYIVGIIKDGRLIYAKGFGAANLEDSMPLGPASEFYMGSASKQFTAACLLYLVEKGKISLGDDIRKYLPEMRDYGTRITVGNLLHHTSGIREYSSLLLFGGHNTSFEEVINNVDIYRLLCRQQGLNFKPGSKYLYSGGGYILLARIIEKVSGTTLRKFADSILFKPLRMEHTFFSDDHGEVIAGRIQSYAPAGTTYRQYLKLFDFVGDGGLFSSIDDLAKWDGAFYHDNLGISDFAHKMYQTVALTNGSPIGYAWGLNIGEYHGLNTTEHGGFMLGYDSELLRFPDQHFTVIVLSNARGQTGSGTIAYQIADLFLSALYQSVVPPPAVPKARLKLYLEEAKKLEGAYWNADENRAIHIDYSGDTLFFNNLHGWRPQLIALARDTFQIKGSGMDLSFFKGHMYLINPGAPIETFEKFDDTPPQSQEELKKYTGTYYSPELQATYRFSVADHSFYLQINHNAPIPLFPATGRIRWNGSDRVWIGFGEIRFISNWQNKLSGLNIGDSRVKGIYLRKSITK
jgi:CubicO group peptidase (beta-lactamase class C family)